MNSFTICLGSNTEPRDAILLKAVGVLKSISTNALSTLPYACESYNGLGATYHNVVIKGETALQISELNSLTKRLEVEAGRLPDSKATGIMPLDIDLIIWNGNIVSPDDYRREHFMIGYKLLTNN